MGFEARRLEIGRRDRLGEVFPQLADLSIPLLAVGFQLIVMVTNVGAIFLKSEEILKRYVTIRMRCLESVPKIRDLLPQPCALIMEAMLQVLVLVVSILEILGG